MSGRAVHEITSYRTATLRVDVRWASIPDSGGRKRVNLRGAE